jgi:CRP/FNR family transcriptional regulator
MFDDRNREDPPVNTPSSFKSGPFKVACSSCNLRELCLPVGLSRPDLERMDTLVSQRR